GVTLGNQPLGRKRASGGIYYLAPYYSSFRMARVDKLIRTKLAAGKLSFADMQQIQADTALTDAAYFTPYILSAFQNGRQAGADPRLAALASSPAVAGAVQVLGGWDTSTPTGIPEGYDASDQNGVPGLKSNAQVANSVAATF